MPDSSPDRYGVNISAAVREELHAGGVWARGNGLRDEFNAALREIDFRLKVEPNDWGESRERLHQLQIQMRCGTSHMVTVLYGVDDKFREVWVKEFRINRRYRLRPDGE